MRVSTRHTLFAGAGAAILITLSGLAWAGGNGGSHGCNTCKPAPPPPPTYNGGGHGSPCCQGGKGHGVNVPGVNVAGPNITIGGTNVNVHGGNLNVSAQSYLNVTAGASASSEVVVYGGGGGGFGGVAPVGVTSIGTLDVTGADETYTDTVTEQVPTTEEYCVDQVSYHMAYRAVQAVCIDDSGAPHPAIRAMATSVCCRRRSDDATKNDDGGRLRASDGHQPLWAFPSDKVAHGEAQGA